MRRVAAVLLTTLLVVACAGADEQAVSDEWGETAEQWRDALYEAASEGRHNVLAFLAEDVVFDERIFASQIRGWDGYRRYGRSVAADMDSSHRQDLFVSAEGFLDQYYWVTPYTVDLLDRVEMQGPVASEFVVAGALDSGRFYVPDVRDFDAIEEFADRYVLLWNGSGEVTDVYVDHASIEDSLLGLSATGLEAITREVGSDVGLDPPPLGVVTLPVHPGGETPAVPGGVRAIYDAPSDVDPSRPDEVRIVFEADDGSGCPGLMAVSLEVDDDRVLTERRYHEVGSVRRCHDAATLERGWWQDIEVPDPVRRDLTEPMVWPERDITIEIYNGTPELTEFVRWGLERFDAAGLVLPDVGSVTFLSKDSTCGGNLGFYGPESSSAATITLCRAADQVCVDKACTTWSPAGRYTLLHEYAHAWMVDNLDEDTQQEFLRFVGLPRWNDRDDDWADRGMERAATAIAFGLFDQPRYAPHDDTTTTCEHSLESFRLLTGKRPLTSCP